MEGGPRRRAAGAADGGTAAAAVVVVYKTGLHLQLGLAGVSCFVAQSAVHWIETAMIRQQIATVPLSFLGTVAAIARDEGPRALYRGFSAAALREFSYSSIRFGLYEPLKNVLGASDPMTAPFYKKVMAGMGAGALASAVASPTDLLKIRMQRSTDAPRSIVSHFREIAGEASPGGVRNFYRGVSATILRASLIGATKMATYDQTKQELKKRTGWTDREDRYKVQLFAAVTAGLAITCASSPATNARTFLMASPPGTYRGLGDAVAAILAQRGVAGFYRGFWAQWARFGPYAVVQFFAWEQLRHMAGMAPL